MAKYSGKIGFIVTKEENEHGPITFADGNRLVISEDDALLIGSPDDVWIPVPVERHYYGDLIRNHKRWDDNQKINSDIVLQNEISIVADPYAMQNFQSIRYAELFGSVWKVTSVDVQYPRLILSIGGVYNGERPSVTP